MSRKTVIDVDRPMKTYRVRNDYDRDNSEIHEWIGESQVKAC